jgi:hypothetical protein
MAAFPILNDPFILAALALIAASAAVLVLLRSRKPWLTRLRRKPLLTANERGCKLAAAGYGAVDRSTRGADVARAGVSGGRDPDSTVGRDRSIPSKH